MRYLSYEERVGLVRFLIEVNEMPLCGIDHWNIERMIDSQETFIDYPDVIAKIAMLGEILEALRQSGGVDRDYHALRDVREEYEALSNKRLLGGAFQLVQYKGHPIYMVAGRTGMGGVAAVDVMDSPGLPAAVTATVKEKFRLP